MQPGNWLRDILSAWRIQLSSMHAAPDFWALTMMTWSSELLREARTRKYSNGALRGAEGQAKKKSRSGMRFFPNAAGVMKLARTWKRPRSGQVWATATISKPGWTCTTPKKAEHHGNDFVPLRIKPWRSFVMRVWHL